MSLQPTSEALDTKTLVLQGAIQGVLERASVASDLQGFFTKLVAYDNSQTRPSAALTISASNNTAIEPSMWNNIATLIPALKLTVEDATRLEIEARDIQLQDFRVKAASFSCSVDQTSSSHGSISVSASDIRAETRHDLQLATLMITTVTAQGGSGLDAAISNLKADWTKSATKLSLQRVDRCTIPGIFELLHPIHNLSISYEDEMLNLDDLTACGVCPLMIRSLPSLGTSPKKAATITDGEQSVLPFPVRMNVKYLQLTPREESNASLHVASATLIFSNSGTCLAINTSGDCKARLVDSSNQHWIQASVGPAVLFIDPNSSSALPEKAHCESLRIGPSSFGHINLTIPSIEMTDGKVLQCGDASGVLQSQDLVEKIKCLWQDCFPSEVNHPSMLSFRIPKAIINISSMNATVVGESIISASPFQQLTCQRFGVQDIRGRSVAFTGFTARMDPASLRVCIECRQTDAFYLPGICSIGNPVDQATKLTYEDGTLSVEIPPIQLLLLEDKEKKCGSAQSKSGTQFELPFPVRCTVREVTVRYPSHGEGSKTTVCRLRCEIYASKPKTSTVVDGATAFCLGFEHFENKLLQLTNTNVSGIVSNLDFSTIHQLNLATESAEVPAGFSSVDWAATFGGNNDGKMRDPVMIPFAALEPFVVRVKCKGLVGVETTAVSIPAFMGGPGTTSEEVVDHLTNALLGRFPAMITNTEFLGESVSALAAKTGGVVLAGSAVGSVVGMVAEDGVRGAIASGKKSRNASSGEKYQFGDFTRGAIRAIKETAKSGAEMRRGSSNEYAVGDFSAGASKAVAGYASQNKSRIGAAGISGVGMVVGCAVAGPIGLLAGSLIGSKVGREAFRTDDDSEVQSPQPARQTQHQPPRLGQPGSQQQSPQTTRRRQKATVQKPQDRIAATEPCAPNRQQPTTRQPIVQSQRHHQHGQRQGQTRGGGSNRNHINSSRGSSKEEEFRAFDGVDFHSW